MKIVVSEAFPVDVVQVDCLDPGKLYGIEHREYETNGKKYKVHRCRNETYMAVGFKTSTGHLHEDEGFDSLQHAFDYCQDRNHKMVEFDDKADFAEWLVQ